MPWVFLDDKFPEHAKVDRAGGDAAWLYVCALAFCRRNNSQDGFVSAARIPLLSDRKSPTQLAERLVDVGLFERVPDGYVVHDYVEWNARSLARSAAGKKAAKARWSQSETDTTAHANALPTQSERKADRDAEPMPSPSPIPINKFSDGSSFRAREPVNTIPSEGQTAELLAEREKYLANAVSLPASFREAVQAARAQSRNGEAG